MYAAVEYLGADREWHRTAEFDKRHAAAAIEQATLDAQNHDAARIVLDNGTILEVIA